VSASDESSADRAHVRKTILSITFPTHSNSSGKMGSEEDPLELKSEMTNPDNLPSLERVMSLGGGGVSSLSGSGGASDRDSSQAQFFPVYATLPVNELGHNYNPDNPNNPKSPNIHRYFCGLIVW